MLDLYHYEPTANSMKVLLCFKEKQLEFNSYYVDLHNFEQHSPEYVAINPNGQVPALIHDGAIITESTVINEYVDEVFPAIPLKPDTPLGRAHMRIWTKFVDEYFNPSVSLIGWHHIVKDIVKDLSDAEFEEMLQKVPLEEQRVKWRLAAKQAFPKEQMEDAKRKIGFSIQRMEKQLSETKWLAGDTYSLADVACYTLTAATPRFFPEFLNEQAAPHTFEWLEAMNERPAVRSALAMSRR
jgi:glutathione S-transferase